MTAIHHNSDLTLKKQAQLKAVNDRRDLMFNTGYTIPSSISTALASKILQTRPEDQANWLTSYSAYSEAAAQGAGAIMGATFRASDNTTTTVSINEGVAILQAMRTWGSQVYARSWALKDQINAATTPTALLAIDVTTGWPS